MIDETIKRTISINLKVWRQISSDDRGKMIDYHIEGVDPDMSFLEMMDYMNENLIRNGEEPVVFDHDCREGICGACSLMINGKPHGPQEKTTTCQLHMRKFTDGETIVVEPFRARAFRVHKDLMIDRSSMDEIIAAGGYISVKTGSAPDGNAIPIPKDKADLAMDAAACIGCGACVASCNNASAMLFTAAKVSQLSLLPQGKIESKERVKNMVRKMDELGFGNCTNEGECSASCPKGIDLSNIARLHREFLTSNCK